MTDAIAPGSLVECVKNDSSTALSHAVAQRLTLGRIYTVTEVFMDLLDREGLNVDGVDPSPYVGWAPIFFKPVRRPDTGKLLMRLARAEGVVEGPVRSEPVKAGAGSAS